MEQDAMEVIEPYKCTECGHGSFFHVMDTRPVTIDKTRGEEENPEEDGYWYVVNIDDGQPEQGSILQCTKCKAHQDIEINCYS